MRAGRVLASGAAFAGALAGVTGSAGADVTEQFTNGAAIAINDNTTATPYPSTITIAGERGAITDVNVVIPSFTHEHSADVDMLLVGPGGQNVLLMSDVGGSNDVAALAVVFDDGAPAIPDGGPMAAGTFSPSDQAGTDETLPAPAPAQPYGSALSVFDGTSPNGTWSLFIDDDFGADDGALPSGWRLEITTRSTVCDAAGEDGFTDVGPANVHESNIDCIVHHNISSGTTATTFAPAANVSRGQMASFVARSIEAAGVALPAAPPDVFTDDNGSVHELRINQLAAAGVIGGNGEQGASYFPTQDMRRDHMASFLAGAVVAVTGAPLAVGPNAFTDDTGNPHEADINALAAADVLSGTGGGLYNPTGSVSRGQMGSFLARFIGFLDLQGAFGA